MRRQGGTQATSATTTGGGVPSIDPTWTDLPESSVVNKDLRADIERYTKLINKGKHYNLIVTAIAREMIAYIWAIAKQVVLIPVNPRLRLARVPA